MANRILVVDDNPVTRRLLRQILEGGGHNVVDARDGTAALEVAARQRFDLVLLDLVVPGTDPFGLVDDLRKAAGTASAPVLACSGFLSKMEEARSQERGFAGFVFKPFEASRLLETVDRHLAPPRSAPEA